MNKLDAARAERAWLQNHFGSEEAPDWGDGRKPSTEQFIACFERIIGPPKQRQSDVCDLTGISKPVMSREFMKKRKTRSDKLSAADKAKRDVENAERGKRKKKEQTEEEQKEAEEEEEE